MQTIDDNIEVEVVGMKSGELRFLDALRKTSLIIEQVVTREQWTDFMSVYIQCYPDREVRPQSVNWVGYERGHVPVSCVSVKHNGHRGIIFDLGTAPGFRGLGYGEDMARYALSFLRDAGCKYAHAALNTVSAKLGKVICSTHPGMEW